MYKLRTWFTDLCIRLLDKLTGGYLTSIQEANDQLVHNTLRLNNLVAEEVKKSDNLREEVYALSSALENSKLNEFAIAWKFMKFKRKLKVKASKTKLIKKSHSKG